MLRFLTRSLSLLRVLLLASLIALTLFIAHNIYKPKPKLQQFQTQYFSMGTKGQIKIYSRSEKIAELILYATISRIKYLDRTLTKFSPNSDIGRLNLAAGKFIFVSQDTINVLKLSQEISNKTHGHFYVGMGNFLSKPGLDEFVPRVGKKNNKTTGTTAKDIFEFNGRWVRLKRRDTMVDLGAIGKGYALDEGLKILKSYNIKYGLIELGGDIVVLGGKPTGPWQIAFDKNIPNITSFINEPKIFLSNGALSTSGSYLKILKDNTKVIHHIVDPYSHNSKSYYDITTVYGPNAATCDALSTAIFNISPSELMQIKKKFPNYKLIAFKAPSIIY